MKKKIKNVILIISVPFYLFFVFFVLSLFFTKGYIPFRSISAFRIFDKLFVEKIYYPLGLESIIGDLDNIRFVFNYPSKYYFLKDKTNKIIPMNTEQGQCALYGYYDRHADYDIQLMNFAAMRMGSIYERKGIPFLYVIDYDYNILFASCKPSILSYFEKANKSNIFSNELFQETEKNNIDQINDKLILLKIGSLWNGPNYGSLILKLYGDGEMRFNYIWYNGPISERPEWRKNIVSIKIPIDSKFIQNKINLIENYKIDKMRTFETRNPWNLYGLVVMVVKNKNKAKILYRDPNPNCFNNILNKYWAEIISKTKLKENLDMILREQANISLDQLHMNHIINMLSYFNN